MATHGGLMAGDDRLPSVRDSAPMDRILAENFAMPISYRCPSCKFLLRSEDSEAGQKIFCSKCGQKIQIPDRRNKTVLGELEENPPGGQPAISRDDRSKAEPATRAPKQEAGEPYREPDADRQQPREAIPDDRGEYSDYGDNRSRPKSKLIPLKAQAISYMLLFGGAWSVLWAFLGVILSGCLCFAWPGTYYAIVFGIIAIIRGAEMLTNPQKAKRSPRTALILQTICAVNLDPVNITCGILGMIFLNDPEVDRYFEPSN